MTGFRATYRLQFRNGMTFERAAALAPYLAELGISHLYASPISRAAPGSTHGYDVANHQELEPELGGEEGFRQLADALRQHDLGLMLDIVPNHMAVSTANPWWRDVLQHGEKSRYAGHFDIDWQAPKLLLPLLGEPYGEALEQGKLKLGVEAGEAVIRYCDLSLPLTPASLEGLGAATDDLEKCVEAINADADLLHRLHERQVWRLACWRLAREALPYRRFFEISDLVGVRVEDAAVFAEVHALPLRLLREGDLDFLRIDHIDGLADPKGYLDRLKQETGGAGVLVEKILGPDEELPPDWGCLGTTGYEVGYRITQLQVARRNEAEMTAAWASFTGEGTDYDELVKSCKRRILTVNLAGELAALVQTAQTVAGQSLKSRELGADSLRLAIIELAVALPVYRTYIDASGPSHQDEELLQAAAAAAKAGPLLEHEGAVDFLLSLLLGPAAKDAERLTFVRRFQQTTGPLTAKAVEDTAFYRYNRLISLNEVGGEPGSFGLSTGDFHAAMKRRADRWPQCLSATATHDTKRGEDARARLAVLSEIPADWRAAVERWHEQLARIDETLAATVHPADAWLLYQALVGAWPGSLTLEKEAELQDQADRLVAFMIKALREAKVRTSWTQPDADYEGSVESFVRCLFEDRARGVLRDIRAMVTRLEPAGLVNSLTQLTLKMTLPGVPDVYQGTELLDHSLVDPDNRRPVDFHRRQKLLAELRDLPASHAMGRWRGGEPKFWLMARLLDARKKHPEIFAQGSYEALTVTGDEADHVLAFSRALGKGRQVVVTVPLQIQHHLEPFAASWLSSAFGRTYLNLGEGELISINGERIPGPEVSLATLWRDLPAAVLLPPG